MDPAVLDAPPAHPTHDRAQWRCTVKLARFGADIDEYRRAYGRTLGERLFEAEQAPESVEAIDGNMLMYGGISNLFQCLIGNGGASSLQYFNNANAYIGVGDSSTAEAATQTDLQAATNKARVGMDSTYPQHTDGTTSGANTITFRATFGSGVANFAWAEFGVFNASAAGRMLNRKVSALGTKSGGSWQLTVTIQLS